VGLELGHEDVEREVRPIDEEGRGPVGHLREQEEMRPEDEQREKAAQEIDPG
jgi:hypothetical protein